MTKRVISVFLCVLCVISSISFIVSAKENKEYTSDNFLSVADGIIAWKKADNGSEPDGYLINDKYLENAGTTPGDWYPIALGRLGIQDNNEGYLAVIKDRVEERYRESGRLSAAKATEWHRIALAVLAMGGDPTNFGTDENGAPVTGATVIVDGTTIGATTEKLRHKAEGEYIQDFVGPLGRPTEAEGKKKVCVVGGGVGCAIALPVAQALKAQGTKVTGIIGFRNKDLVILEDEFRACCDELIIMSDDGSYGQKGVVTMPLEEKIKAGAHFDEVITIGPLIMMKFVVKTTKPYNVKTVVSMNPIMVDGTGMCGGCRLTVGGKTKFACVDGPDFDGFEVDFDEAMHRGTMYRDFEAHAREAECNLLKKEVE